MYFSTYWLCTFCNNYYTKFFSSIFSIVNAIVVSVSAVGRKKYCAHRSGQAAAAEVYRLSIAAPIIPASLPSLAIFISVLSRLYLEYCSMFTISSSGLSR